MIREHWKVWGAVYCQSISLGGLILLSTELNAIFGSQFVFFFSLLLGGSPFTDFFFFHSLIFECWTVCILVKIMHGSWCAEVGLYELMRADTTHLFPTPHSGTLCWSLNLPIGHGGRFTPWKSIQRGLPPPTGEPVYQRNTTTMLFIHCWIWFAGVLFICPSAWGKVYCFVLFCFCNIFWYYLAS